MIDSSSNHAHKEPEELSTVEVRQGTGPRDMVTVLTVSLALATAVGVGLLAYFLS